jgi:hypothetical protein
MGMDITGVHDCSRFALAASLGHNAQVENSNFTKEMRKGTLACNPGPAPETSRA